jgi:hypothetical protein
VKIDKQIIDAFAVVAVLLTFVFAFFTILVALTEALLGARVPDVDADITKVKGQLLAYAVLFAIVGVVAILVALATTPLLSMVVTRSGWVPWQSDYRVVRGGLVLTDLLLLGTFVAAAVDLARLLSRKSQM